MKIFFRYLFLRLFVPFAVCLCGCTLIWIMADLYGNIDDFLEHKINVFKILYFYFLQIPSMLVQILPASLLFSTLWTLLALNRRCELVAFQSGGMAPIWLFTPFFAFACIWMVILAIDLNGLAASAEVKRERILLQVKGQNAKKNVLLNLPYVDKVNRRVWFFQSLDTNQGTAGGMELLQRDDQGHDQVKYFATKAEWTGEFWRLTGGVLEIRFGLDNTVQARKTYKELDLPDVTTPPSQLSLIVSQPDQLTLTQLSQYIATSTATPEHLAGYRTEWWYRVLYPFSLIVLMLFALHHGTRTDRRSPVAGVVWAIVVLILYVLFMNGFMALGRHDRLSPFLSVIAMQIVFGAIGLHLLALSNGWWWQLLEAARRWQARRSEGEVSERDDER
ncbi:MAG TPA: LptF/LptG family permease [Candidatus Methylacidiphilales bacterium]|jgi:lipopolysaccharide export system permease protein|nr:LptF/LptG family permease [Candidatus Methylacidiphilales bacterium]